MPTTPPTVHMNGTSRESLLSGFRGAHSALLIARDALAATMPNGRDFYVQPAGSLSKAMQEHVDRLRAIDSLLRDMETLYCATEG